MLLFFLLAAEFPLAGKSEADIVQAIQGTVNQLQSITLPVRDSDVLPNITCFTTQQEDPQKMEPFAKIIYLLYVHRLCIRTPIEETFLDQNRLFTEGSQNLPNGVFTSVKWIGGGGRAMVFAASMSDGRKVALRVPGYGDAVHGAHLRAKLENRTGFFPEIFGCIQLQIPAQKQSIRVTCMQLVNTDVEVFVKTQKITASMVFEQILGAWLGKCVACLIIGESNKLRNIGLVQAKLRAYRIGTVTFSFPASFMPVQLDLEEAYQVISGGYTNLLDFSGPKAFIDVLPAAAQQVFESDTNSRTITIFDFLAQNFSDFILQPGQALPEGTKIYNVDVDG